MTYGLGTRVFIEDGPAEQVARADRSAPRPEHGTFSMKRAGWRSSNGR